MCANSELRYGKARAKWEKAYSERKKARHSGTERKNTATLNTPTLGYIKAEKKSVGLEKNSREERLMFRGCCEEGGREMAERDETVVLNGKSKLTSNEKLLRFARL
jgi:hypothetical protein